MGAQRPQERSLGLIELLIFGKIKPRNAIGLAKDLPREEMETLILAHTTVSDEDLHLLAEHRAQIVRDGLVGKASIPAERVFLVAPKLDAEGVKEKGNATRVDFALR